MRLSRLVALAVALAIPSLGGTAEVERARKLYQNTNFEAAIRMVAPEAERNAAAAALAGQSYYMMADFKKATTYLEKAVALEPNNSDYLLWLGRAWGRRAESSSFVTAPGYASKARQNFERAVQLNPKNAEAINDLFEYYLEAPGFLGGGLDKAAGLAERIRELDPAEYHFAKARLAEKRKEFQTAEQQLRRAIDVAPRQVGRLVDLAKFLSKQGRFSESEATFQRARTIAPQDPKIAFEEASAYIRAGRNLDTARNLLKKYLEAPLTPDDPPRREAETLLKQLPKAG